MLSQEITKRWLDYFEGQGHTVVPSASLISSQPGAMFTIAGMVPFIPYFLGQETAPYRRATSIQKCIRTLDIDEVGKTARHGTFFQMAGNFSFGDYFKERAIPMAWELLTGPVDEGRFGLDPDRLWVTVYEDDEESYTLWKDTVGVPAERIQRMGRAENYWDTGQPGPAGPCSEIFIDQGDVGGIEAKGQDRRPSKQAIDLGGVHDRPVPGLGRPAERLGTGAAGLGRRDRVAVLELRP